MISVLLAGALICPLPFQLLQDEVRKTATREAFKAHLNGMALFLQGKYSQALTINDRALALREKLFPNGHRDLAISLSNRGVLLTALQDYETALPPLQRALAIFQSIYPESKYPAGLIEISTAHDNIGLLYRERGDFERALEHYEASLALLFRKFPHDKFPDGNSDLATAISNVGSILNSLGQYEKSMERAETALAMRLKCYPKHAYPNGHHELANSYNNLANLLQDRGAYSKSIALYEIAVGMLRHVYPKSKFPNGHPELALAINNLASVRHSQGDYASARPLYEECLAMLEALYPVAQFPVRHPSTSLILNNLASLLKDSGDYDGARPLFERALALRQARYSEANYPIGHPDLATSLLNLGRLRHVQGQWVDAAKLYRDATAMWGALARREILTAPESDALAFLQRIPRSLDAYLSATLKIPDADEAAYRAAWDSKAISTRILERRHAAARLGGENSRNQLKRLGEIHRGIERLLQDSRIEPNERRDRVARLGEERDRVERELAKSLPILDRWKERDRRGPESLASRMPEGTAFVDLVSYTRFDSDPQRKGAAGTRLTPTYVAFVVVKGDAPRRVDLGDSQPIDEAVDRWRRVIAQRQPDREAAEKVRRLVWAPIASRLPARVTTLFLSTDGDLARLPWSALPGSTDGSVLLEEVAFSFVPNGPALLEMLEQSPPGRDEPVNWLAVGALDYGNSTWPTLPGAKAELDALAPTATRLSGADATLNAIRDALPRARFAHFATHGYFDHEALAAERKREHESLRNWQLPSPAHVPARNATTHPLGYVGVVLSHGVVMTGLSLVDLPLEGLQLVTLSACKTGLGEVTAGEGVFGLIRAFQLAGCANVIASLWNVNDAATTALMAKFYHEMRTNKKSPLDALREAQLTIYRHPELIPDLAGERGAPKAKEALALKLKEKGAAARARSDTKLWAAFVLSGIGR